MREQGQLVRRARTAAAGLTLTALLSFPAFAAAGTKSKSATAAGDFAIASATAKCPSGQRATGGGFATSAATMFPFILVYESRKIGQRSWRASGQVFAPFAIGPARTLKAFAYCDDGAPATKSKSASITSTGANALLAADAKCSSGQQAQAGGFLGPPPNRGGGGLENHRVADSYRSDKKTWRSRMRTFVAAVGVTFTSYVYCADKKKPAARIGSTTVAGDDVLATALSFECKRDTKPAAGGFNQLNAAPASNFFHFYESLKSGKGWRASAYHGGTTSTTLNSIAYCA
jgi:hypothetical protein